MLFLAGVRETSLILLCHTGACPGQEHRASYPICLNVFKAGNPADPHEVEYVLASCFDQHTFVTTSQGRFDFSIFEILRVLCLIMRWRRSASPSTCSSPASFWFSFYLPLTLFFFFLATPWACGILFSWPGIKPVLHALKAWSLNPWAIREVPLPPAAFTFHL